MSIPKISKIRIYPIKSLDPVELDQVEIGVRSLRHDRAYAMLAMDGRFVNGKRTGRVNQLQAKYDLENLMVNLKDRDEEQWRKFELKEGNKELDQYLSDFFDLETILIHRTQGELMDIPTASSVTIVSEASLKSLEKDLDVPDLENLRLRFRTNLEVSDVEPYWEEQLFGQPGIGMRIQMGEVEMIGVSPRARCNVPPKDPFSGEMDMTFVKNMMKSRERTLPKESKLPQYGRLYHLTVNTFIPDSEQGKMIRVGDTIDIKEPVNLNM